MIDRLVTIIQNERPEEVILMFTKKESGISLPILDGFYSTSGWPHVKHNLGLFDVLQGMRASGLIKQTNMQITKGPLWREAKFILENKYPIK